MNMEKNPGVDSAILVNRSVQKPDPFSLGVWRFSGNKHPWNGEGTPRNRWQVISGLRRKRDREKHLPFANPLKKKGGTHMASD